MFCADGIQAVESTSKELKQEKLVKIILQLQR